MLNLGRLVLRFPKKLPINQIISIQYTTLIFRPSSNLYPLCSIHTSSPFYNSNSKPSPPPPSQLNYEEPPKSDTIVPAPMSSAFRNMFDDSAISATQMISRITNDGFITTNEVEIKGPVILLNGDLFMWDVPQGQGFGRGKDRKGGVFDNWITDFLKLFEVVIPKPELLIFGTGKSFVPIPSHIKQYLNDLGMQIEIIDTRNAVATFNVLAEEGRDVAAALLPLVPTNARTGKPFT